MPSSTSSTPDLGIDDREAYLTLALTPGVGPERLASLLAACGSPGGALVAPFAFLCTIPGISRACAAAIRTGRRDAGGHLLRAVDRLGGRILVPFDPEFPQLLLGIPAPPPFLVAAGRLELLTAPAVAVVGSRDHTRYGADVCRRVALTAALAGVVVVSGMARGLDAVAHRAALEAGGGTIGVLGAGIDVVYPKANLGLYQAMRRDGLLLTEFPPGDRPTAGSFPRRNRLISGLARVTVVVEASVTSGALLTAGSALAQGRDVLVVPGPITSATAGGANRLLRDGAAPLIDPADLLTFYPEVRPVAPTAAGPGGLQARVLAILHEGGRHIDDLCALLDLPPGRLLSLLGAMELMGLVRQAPGLVFSAELLPPALRPPAGV